MQWFWWRLSLFALIFLRLWWVCIWKCLRERGVCEHGRVIQLFLQSSVGSRQHTATLHWSQHHRGCDTHTQTDSIFFFWQFILLGYSKKKYNLVSWLLKWYFSDSLIFLLNPSHCTSQKLWTQKMTCTWIFAGSNSRATTCVPNRYQIAELHTLSVAACTVLPGVNTVPSVPGKTLVRSRNQIR